MAPPEETAAEGSAGSFVPDPDDPRFGRLVEGDARALGEAAATIGWWFDCEARA
jgi:hypothetical protein